MPKITGLPPTPLCPEGAKRAAMTDAEFWEHVYPQHRWGEPRPLDSDELAELNLNAKLAECPECGQYGACSYDSEGRPLIHVITDEDEAND